MSRFSGPQPKHDRGQIMRNYRAQKKAAALDRQRNEKLRDEQRKPTSKHHWVPSNTDFSCICTNDTCTERWLPEEAHPPQTACPKVREPKPEKVNASHS
jgi:hypothetical protein